MVYVTHPDEKGAQSLARLCLEKKLIACANIQAPVTSLYRWKGEVCQEREWVLILKTSTSHYLELEKFIQSVHPSECPCILSLSTTHILSPFRDWLESNLK